jgi:hypothetical protein
LAIRASACSEQRALRPLAIRDRRRVLTAGDGLGCNKSSQDHWFRNRNALIPAAAKQQKALNAAAQFAAILDEVVAAPVGINLLKPHGLVANRAGHQI